MEVFSLVLNQMLMMFLLLAAGYFLKVKKLIPDQAGTALAKLEALILVPAQSFSVQLTRCTVENFRTNGIAILFGFLCYGSAIALSKPLSKLFVKKAEIGTPKEYQQNIYRYAVAFSNFGYMGNFIVQGIWGTEVLSHYMLFNFAGTLLCYSWGVCLLIPRGKGDTNFWSQLLKGMKKPTFIAIILGIIGGMLNLKQYVPQFALSALDNCSNCMGPCAMLLAGIMIGECALKDLLTIKKVYAMSALRLLIIPGVFTVLLKLCAVRPDICLYEMLAFSCPLGLNTIVFPAAFGGEVRTGTSMTLISTVLSVATIPLLYYIFNVLWV